MTALTVAICPVGGNEATCRKCLFTEDLGSPSLILRV